MGCGREGDADLRKLGIIGGTSWASTALYYEHINRGIAAAPRRPAQRGPVPSRASTSLPLPPCSSPGDWDGVASVAVEAAPAAQGGGAEGLLLASNTVHKVEGAVAAETGLPVLHIADAAADRLVADGRTRVALLGTRFTMTEPFVRERIESRGIALAPIEPAGSAKSTASSTRSSPPAASSATASAS